MVALAVASLAATSAATSFAAVPGRPETPVATSLAPALVSLSVKRFGARFELTVEAPAHGACLLAVSAAGRSFSFASIRTGRLDRGTVGWRAAKSAPSGVYTFSATCRIADQRQQAATHLYVPPLGGASSTGALVVTGTTKLTNGAQLSSPRAVTPAPSADTGGYPYASAPDCSAEYGTYAWCVNGDDISSFGYAYRNCTDYVAWKVHAVFGIVLPQTLGNGSTWGSNLHAAGYAYDSAPRIGDIAAWNSGTGGFGHVAFVYAVRGTVASLDEYNAAGRGLFSSNRTTAAGSAGAPDEYVHIAREG